MPELPEVKTLARRLKQLLVGRKIKDVKINLPKIINTTPTEFRERVGNNRITSVKHQGKIIMLELSNGYLICLHLKISGQLLYSLRSEPIEKHTHIIFELDNGNQLRFRDVRQFGYVKIFSKSEVSELLKNLGPEPLEKAFTLRVFRKMLETRSLSRIKPLLMNQNFLAGIGNLYTDEILFAAKIHPLRKVKTLSYKEINKLFFAIKNILTIAIKYKGTSQESDNSVGSEGKYQNYLKVYQRENEPCFRCQTPIRRFKINSRSAYFCPRCQPYR